MLTFVRFPHCSRAARSALIAGLALSTSGRPIVEAQTPAPSTFLVFLRSQSIGNEQVSVERTAEGWTVIGSGRMGPPIDLCHPVIKQTGTFAAIARTP